MKPLIVLITVSLLALFINKLVNGAYDIPQAARIGMSAMLLLTAIGHFRFTNGMAMMIPDIIPNKTAVVYITGVLEIIAAICLSIAATREITGILLIIFFVLLLPANIYAAMHQVDYEKATGGGPGIKYLWFRIPLQILFIVWVWFCALSA